MKKTVFLFFTFFLVVIAFHACEKIIESPQKGKSSSEKCGTIGSHYDMENAIIVAPVSPDFDTRNLLNAFKEAKEKGPGSVVRLTEGTFYLDKMEIFDFEGWFKGMGSDKTEIRLLEEGLEVIPENPFFISFRGGNIRISDLSFNVPNDNPCKPWVFPSGETVTFIAAIVNIIGNSVEDNRANSQFQNVSFRGKYVDQFNFTPYNIDNFILINGGALDIQPFEGHHMIQNCEFVSAETAINALGLSNSTLVVGGNQFTSNYIKDVNTGINIYDSEKSSIKCTNNHLEKIRNLGGISFRQGVLPAVFANLNPNSSHFFAANNTIRVNGTAPAIDVHDYVAIDVPEQFSKIVLLNNRIMLKNADAKGIYAYGANCMHALKNNISGHSAYGIGIFGPAHHGKILFNDFQHLEALQADIILGEETHHNFILCNRWSEIKVEDNGTDNVVNRTSRKPGKKEHH